ncbi:hypothetical protein GCM10010869_10650 [Mesorhizobium tianshanense]|uniref:Sodium:dicarboxylate symporter family protein n=1 Tax=Mesorhizobium tianshanense TaxID=39844 RepID=A0A562N472_9HYPH|nr:sodium:dicarboxylate symporter family protein [Mesorhizobium tianshanense]GLS35477.1 hypothetical protein GCM10010869_10650 [Mesorhizobium tianshanense]
MLNRPIRSASPAPRKAFYAKPYVQVLAAIALGIALGHFYPELGESLKPLGDAFIKLVKMIIAPVIFLTIASGVANGGRGWPARANAAQGWGAGREAVIEEPPAGISIDEAPQLPVLRELLGKRSNAMTHFCAKRHRCCPAVHC